MDKKELRARIRARKRQMTPEEIALRSEKLRQALLETDRYRAAETIYGYLPYNQEVRTVPILEQALRDGKQYSATPCASFCCRIYPG